MKNTQHDQAAQCYGFGDRKYILNDFSVTESESIAQGEKKDDRNRQQLGC